MVFKQSKSKHFLYAKIIALLPFCHLCPSPVAPSTPWPACQRQRYGTNPPPSCRVIQSPLHTESPGWGPAEGKVINYHSLTFYIMWHDGPSFKAQVGISQNWAVLILLLKALNVMIRLVQTPSFPPRTISCHISHINYFQQLNVLHVYFFGRLWIFAISLPMLLSSTVSFENMRKSHI